MIDSLAPSAASAPLAHTLRGGPKGAPNDALHDALNDALRVRSRSVRLLGAIGVAYIAAFAAAVVAWLLLRGTPPTVWLIGPAVLLPALAAVLALRSTADSRRYTMHVVLAVLALPVVLLFWADSFDGEAPATAPPLAADVLDTQPLFAGAAALQGSDQRIAGMPMLQAAAFADGSELRITHHGDPALAARQIAMLEQALQGVAFTEGGRHGIRLQGASVGSTFILVEQHGGDVLELRARNVPTGLARLAAQNVPPPSGAAAAAANSTTATSATAASGSARWPFFVSAAAVHALCFVAMIAWAGSATTRIAAAPGIAPVAAHALQQRLGSIARDVPTLQLTQPGAQTLRIECLLGERRSHLITLTLDEAAHRVQVAEKIAVRGDAPCDADEARMDSFADSTLDPSRPDAQRVWSSTRQATMIEPQRLAAVPLQLQANTARFPAAYVASLDAEGVLTALCAIVTRSGWHWQPRLIGG